MNLPLRIVKYIHLCSLEYPFNSSIWESNFSMSFRKSSALSFERQGALVMSFMIARVSRTHFADLRIAHLPPRLGSWNLSGRHYWYLQAHFPESPYVVEENEISSELVWAFEYQLVTNLIKRSLSLKWPKVSYWECAMGGIIISLASDCHRFAHQSMC